MSDLLEAIDLVARTPLGMHETIVRADRDYGFIIMSRDNNENGVNRIDSFVSAEEMLKDEHALADAIRKNRRELGFPSDRPKYTLAEAAEHLKLYSWVTFRPDLDTPLVSFLEVTQSPPYLNKDGEIVVDLKHGDGVNIDHITLIA